MDESSLQRLQYLAQEAKEIHEQTEKELQEIEFSVKQSTRELERLSERNTQIANRVGQIEANLGAYSREDIKEAYTAAQDSQRRLFTLRGRVEQLEGRREALERQSLQFRRLIEVLEEVEPLIEQKEGSTVGLSEANAIQRVIEAQEWERQRLARQMHDGPAQSLTNLILQAEICERLLDIDPDQARAELANLKEAVNTTFQKTRHFIFGLRPMMLDDLGLIPTLRRYIQDFREKTGLSVDLEIMGEERRLASHLEVIVFRGLQELLNNVDQHAHATHVDVDLNLEGERLTLTVEDDGSGFEVKETLAAAQERRAVGLATLQERVTMLGGSVEIDSGVGRGTRVRLAMPAA